MKPDLYRARHEKRVLAAIGDYLNNKKKNPKRKRRKKESVYDKRGVLAFDVGEQRFNMPDGYAGEEPAPQVEQRDTPEGGLSERPVRVIPKGVLPANLPEEPPDPNRCGWTTIAQQTTSRAL